MSHDIRPVVRQFMPELIKRILSRIGHSCNVEIFLKDLQRKCIPIDACIDVGAADGDFSELFSKHFNGNRIFLFEPRVEKFNKLQKKFLKHSIVYAELISDLDEIKSFAVKGNASSFYDVSETDNIVKLKSTRLDNILRFSDFKNSLVKIDVQGAELNVLMSIGSDNLKSISAFIIEASTLSLWKNQSDLFEIMEFMNKYGFYLYSIGHMHRDKKNYVIQIDLCFINREFKDI